MRHILLTFPFLVLGGCATHRPVAVVMPPTPAIAAAMPTKVVETRYEVRGYREAADPSIRHEAHVVYRRTRVPLNAGESRETVPRTAYAPASYAPLPPAAELNAELMNQKAITAELCGMKVAMAETQRRMETQYAQLVRQSAEATKLRAQLDAERNRLRSGAPPAAAGSVVSNATDSTESKW